MKTIPSQARAGPSQTIPMVPWCPRAMAYVLAGLSPIAAVWINFKLPALIGGNPLLFVLLPPIILSAYLGGLGPGLTATLLTALLANYYFLPPFHSFHLLQTTDAVRWWILILIGVMVSLISEALHRARWRAEESRRCYEVTLGSIGDAVITTDQQGRILLLNAEAEHLTGWTNPQAGGHQLTEVFNIINETTRLPREDPVKKVLRLGEVVGLANHTLLLARDGREIPIEDNGAPIKRADGEIIGMVVVFRDCTVKKQAENALRESEARYRSLFENMLEGFACSRMIFDGDKPQDFIYLDVNLAFEKLTGLKNVIGKKATEVIPGLRETNPELFEIYGRVALTGRPEKFETYVDALGSWYSIAVYSYQKDHFVAVFDNITERKQMERTLEFVAQSSWMERPEDFLSRLVEHLGRTLGMDHVLVGRLKDFKTVQTIGLFSRGRIVSDVEYAICGTPCQNVAGKALVHFPEKIQELFPEDKMLGEMGAQSYLGIPLASASGSPLGLLAVLDTKPMPDARLAAALLQIAAIRAASELEKLAAGTALRESENLYRSLVKASPDAVTVTNLEGQIEFVSTRALEIFGHASAEEAIGHNLFEWVATEDHAKARASIRELFASKHLYEIEFSLLKKDGSRFSGEINAAILSAADGSPKGFILITRDVTERNRAAETQRLLAIALEQAAENILITDAAAKIIYVNPAFETNTGFTLEKVIGCNPRILKSGKQNSEFYRSMWEKLRRGEVWSGRLINRKKDGTLYEDESAISPIRDATGKIVNYVGVGRDVSRVVALEAQLRQSQKMEAIGQLAGGIAHDFNNLLTAIRGNASLLQLGSQTLPPEISDCAQQIVEAAERAAGLTRQLLMFGRKQALQIIRLDLNEVVAQMTKLLQRILGEDISLSSNYAASLPPILADTGMIEQILLNLAVNSRDAMPRGGQLCITTGTEILGADAAGNTPASPPGLHVRLTVSDNGSGISEKDQAHIFEPFFTTKEVGKGTGLGLATVHGIVQQHNGRIAVTSEPGQGTTFHIYFPVAAGGREEKTAAPGQIQPQRGSETLLVVEDELIVRLTVSNMLQRLGYTVLTAESGVAALKLWQLHRDKIQLVLTDIVMPDGLTGYELARKLQTEKPSVKVIYTSGYNGDVADKRLRMIEDVNFLQKPYAPQKLAAALRRNLDSR